MPKIKDIIEPSNIQLECNIITYSKYVSSVIKEKEINDLINLLDPNKKKKILELWENLHEFNDLNEIFEKDFVDALEKSYFEYSLVEISLNLLINLKKFLFGSKKCDNCILKS